jgi:oligopeptide transport system substrate-binding protein
MLAQDLPTMPMWYPTTVVGFSDKVTNVKINAFGVLDFSAIQVK